MARLGLQLRAALGLWLATICAAATQAQVRAVDLYAPRAFGYAIGDIVAHRVEIELDGAYRLDPASLPQPHALNYWLELKDVRVEDHGPDGGARRYTINLVYQTFYAPLEPKRLDIPALALSAVSGEHRAAVTVPAWSFLMSPLREIVATGPGQTMALRPDIPPRPIPTARTLHALIATAAVAALALAALVWQMGWWPFNRLAQPAVRASRAPGAHRACAITRLSAPRRPPIAPRSSLSTAPSTQRRAKVSSPRTCPPSSRCILRFARSKARCGACSPPPAAPSSAAILPPARRANCRRRISLPCPASCAPSNGSRHELGPRDGAGGALAGGSSSCPRAAFPGAPAVRGEPVRAPRHPCRDAGPARPALQHCFTCASAGG